MGVQVATRVGVVNGGFASTLMWNFWSLCIAVGNLEPLEDRALWGWVWMMHCVVSPRPSCGMAKSTCGTEARQERLQC